MSPRLTSWSIASSGLATQHLNNYVFVILNRPFLSDSHDYWTMPLSR